MLGTSGWSYKEWIGPFYRKKEQRMLTAYSRVFKTVEIDSTFYSYPSKGTAMGWLRYSPTDFIFAAKLPKLITHEKKLDLKRGVEEDLTRFCELMEPLSLNGKLGCMLIQLPPKLVFDLELLEGFFQILPANIGFAVEFRDRSWMSGETWRLLKKYNVAYTIVDEPLLPPEVQVTSDIAYFRWHGKGRRPWYDYRYSLDELKPWIPKVKQVAEKVRTVYGYFNNHYHGYAVENCLQALEMTGNLTPIQAGTKTAVENYLNAPPRAETGSLEAFMRPEEMAFEDLLKGVIDRFRLERARRLEDQEVTIQESTEKQVTALVRGYRITIDLQNRLIMHDCEDWSKISQTKQLCKHVGKLLMVMDEEKASAILRQVLAEKDSWEFRLYET